MTVSFAVSRDEFALIDAIVDRAQAVAHRLRVPFDRQGARMDITAVHANGCPLKLDVLLEAPDFDFNHDVFGIFRHIDRDTGTPRRLLPATVLSAMTATTSLWRGTPCAYMATGKLCGRSDERPTVLDPILGQICADHRPDLARKPQPAQVQEETHA